jgi:hypothetical protein
MKIGDLVYWDHRTLSNPKEVWIVVKCGLSEWSSVSIRSSRRGITFRANPNRLREIETDKK